VNQNLSVRFRPARFPTETIRRVRPSFKHSVRNLFSGEVRFAFFFRRLRGRHSEPELVLPTLLHLFFLPARSPATFFPAPASTRPSPPSMPFSREAFLGKRGHLPRLLPFSRLAFPHFFFVSDLPPFRSFFSALFHRAKCIDSPPVRRLARVPPFTRKEAFSLFFRAFPRHGKRHDPVPGDRMKVCPFLCRKPPSPPPFVLY